ncbi:hypothetical protein [Flagellimonas amoyensis]|uniref:hypothetical protein n=1 Tax=Flagellimonas amoyensis TaxID=2169401 RepID=UPI000D3499AA|nr:hypothetical protein [Allomuricauda amoyensis]
MKKIHPTTRIGIYIYGIATAIWAILCVVTNEFTKNDKGFLTGLGFLIIFAVSIFMANDKIKLRQLLYSIFLIPFIFFVASFLIGLLTMWLGWKLDIPEFGVTVLFKVLSSFVAALGLGLVLSFIYKINRLKKVFFLIFIPAIVANFFVEIIDGTLLYNYDIPPRVTMFTIWQTLTILPIFYLINKKNIFISKKKKTHYNKV